MQPVPAISFIETSNKGQGQVTVSIYFTEPIFDMVCLISKANAYEITTKFGTQVLPSEDKTQIGGLILSYHVILVQNIAIIAKRFPENISSVIKVSRCQDVLTKRPF